MITEQATQATETFNAGIKELFPKFLAKAYVKNILGPCLLVEFANVASRDQCPSGIIQNATGHMQFMMHLTDNRGGVLAEGSPVEINLNTWHYKCRESLKFRKIKGKTPADALAKLLEWFKKNADKIRAL